MNDTWKTLPDSWEAFLTEATSINKADYKHEWIFDLPWHMVDLKDWFYMVNVGRIGSTVFLHVRILGVRSLWTFESR